MTTNAAWQFERIHFPFDLPVHSFFHHVGSVDFHYHVALEFLFILSGKITVLTNGRQVLVSEGEIALIHSGEPHATYDATGSSNLVLALQIDPSIVKNDPQFSMRRFDISSSLKDKKIAQTLWNYASDITNEIRIKRTAFIMEVEAFTLKFLSFLLREIPQSILQEEEHLTLMPDEARLLNQRLRHVADFIRQHASETISISDVSKALNLSSGYLSRLFKIETGESFGRFMTQVRLRKSLELLCAKVPMSITDIAFECGFPNIKAFNLAFRRELDTTPGLWRKKQLLSLHEQQNLSKSGYFIPDERHALRLLGQFVQ